MENPPVRLLVVDDFGPFLQFISSKLAKRRDLQVVCEVSDGEEAIRRATELKPDLILLDVGLPTLSGIEAARQIRELVPKAKIIFVSQYSDPEIVQEALNLGASGYILKPNIGSDLLPAINAALEGRQFVSRGLISDSSA
jgi:two-component system NarL family response regulator